jgi:hypothetical protein
VVKLKGKNNKYTYDYSFIICDARGTRKSSWIQSAFVTKRELILIKEFK